MTIEPTSAPAPSESTRKFSRVPIDLIDRLVAAKGAADRQQVSAAVCTTVYAMVDGEYTNRKTGESWPSHGLLAKRCGISRPQVIRALDQLEAIGALSWVKRRRPDGGQSSNVYTIPEFDTPVRPRTPPCPSTDTPLSAGDTPPCPSTQHHEQESVSNQNQLIKNQLNTSAFDEFWQVWPLAKAKADARRAFDAAVKAGHDPTQINVGLQRLLPELVAAKERGFCPHASTWLRAERWNDEPTTATPTPTTKAGARASVVAYLQQRAANAARDERTDPTTATTNKRNAIATTSREST